MTQRSGNKLHFYIFLLLKSVVSLMMIQHEHVQDVTNAGNLPLLFIFLLFLFLSSSDCGYSGFADLCF